MHSLVYLQNSCSVAEAYAQTYSTVQPTNILHYITRQWINKQQIPTNVHLQLYYFCFAGCCPLPLICAEGIHRLGFLDETLEDVAV